MKKVAFLIFLIPFVSFSQNKLDLGRSYCDTLPEHWNIDVGELAEHIYAGVPDNLKTEYERLTYRFSHLMAFQISDLILNEDVYYDWPVFEDYLNQILARVMPDELKKDSVVHMYLVKDGSFNAYMTPSGHSFMHIGVMAEVQDEASIAGIFAHELAHYYLHHSLDRFVNSKTKAFNRGIFKSERAINRFNIDNELQADSLARVWLLESGYHLDGLKSVNEIMERLEQNMVDRSPHKFELDETSHPLATKRSKAFEDFKKTSGREAGKRFLVSGKLFYQLKEESKSEILKHLINGFRYHSCIEMAFRFHLFDPNNATHIYYLLEGIRRASYLSVDLWKENFISHRYFVEDLTGKVPRKKERERHFFEFFDQQVLGIDSAQMTKVKAHFYWEETKFVSNEGAFEFFYRVSQLLGNNECILSNALSLSHVKDQRDKYLKAYLEKEHIKQREYAQNLLDDNLRKQLDNKKLLVVTDFSAVVRQGTEDVPIYNTTDFVPCFFDTLCSGFQDRTPLYLPDVRQNHLNEYYQLSRLRTFSWTQIWSKGSAPELHILDPQFWNIFTKYNVNEIEFLQCEFIESAKQCRTVEDLKKAIDTDFMSLLHKEKTTRYMHVFISSVKEKDGERMKVKYAAKEDFKFRKPALGQMNDMFAISFKMKQKRAEYLDHQYRSNDLD